MNKMNKLIPWTKFSKSNNRLIPSDGVSVIVDGKNTPLGFVFHRDSFISLLEKIDDEYEQKIGSPKLSSAGLAGKLIDLIEQNLAVNPKFAAELKQAIATAQKEGWIPFSEIEKSLNV